MREIDTSKKWFGVVECYGLGFDERGCGKTFLAGTSDLRFHPERPGVLYTVCPCGARNLAHVSEALKDLITGTVRWIEPSGDGDYRLMAERVAMPTDTLLN